jgi:hypothetical protein
MNQAGRRFLSSLMVLFALPFALLGLVGNDDLAAYSLSKSRAIANRFAVAAARTEAFRVRHGALPTEEQFSELFADQKGQVFQVFLSRPADAQCDDHEATFQALPGDVYVLMVFRGEWFECAAPQLGLTTVSLDPDQYYVTGNRILDRVFWVSAALGLLAAAFALWRRRPEEGR